MRSPDVRGMGHSARDAGCWPARTRSTRRSPRFPACPWSCSTAESRIRALHGTALQRHGYVDELMIGRPHRRGHAAGVWGAARAALHARDRRRDRHDPAALAGRRGGLRIHLQPRPAERARGRRPDDVARHHRAASAEAGSRRPTRSSERAVPGHPRPQPDRDLPARPRAALVVTNAEACGFIGKSADQLARPHDGRDRHAWVERTGRPTTARSWSTGEAHELRGVRPGRPHRRDPPLLVAEISRPRHPRVEIVGVGGVSLDVTDRERLGTRADRGAPALRDGVRVRPRRHAREPRLQRRHRRRDRVQRGLRTHARP